jgi:hypothetical protein
MSFTIDLGKIKFHYAGEWQPTTTYTRDDVVYHNGSSYVCTPKTSLNADPASTPAQWSKIAQGSDLGALVQSGGDLFYYDGTDFQRIAPGSEHQTLVMVNGVPTWKHQGIIQIDGRTDATDGGSYSAAVVYEIPNLDFEMTTRADNSKFLCTVRCQVDDVSSSSFGASVGIRYSIGAGTSDWQYIHWPDQHTQYQSGGSDTYLDLEETYFYQTMNQPAGTVIRFQGLIESHNVGFRLFNGGNDGSPKRGGEIIIQEYAD